MAANSITNQAGGERPELYGLGTIALRRGRAAKISDIGDSMEPQVFCE